MQKIITWRGKRLNQRTIDMIKAAEKITGLTFLLAQGSYRAGQTAASAGTHDGGGAVDIDLKNMPEIRRERIRDAMRQVGFAAWIRDPSQGDWNWHCHGIAVGDKDVSPSAGRQVVAYHNKKNGLANGGPDDGPGTWRTMTWEKYKAAHPPVVVKPPTKPTEVDVTPAQMQELKNYIDGRMDESDKLMRRNAARILRYGLQTEDERMKANDRYDEVKAAGGTEAQALDAMWQVLAPLDAALAAEAAAI